MRTLVFGGAGYIGSIVAHALVECGHDVTVADDLSTGHRWAVPAAARFVHVDIQDAHAVDAAVSGHDALLHFAARSIVADSVRDPIGYFRANVTGSLNVLEAVAVHGVRRMVFSSTAAVYGEPSSIPIHETATPVPTNPYGASKLAVDQAIAFQARATNLGAVSLRYFNVAGAAFGIGEMHAPETHLIPSVLEAARDNRLPVQLFGTDYPTEDGTAIRDYVHVADLARAHLLALDCIDGPGHRVYNLGSGCGFSVAEVIATARRVTGAPIAVVERPRRDGDPPVLVASNDRIRQQLGWTPDRDLTDMVADAWGWASRRETVLTRGET